MNLPARSMREEFQQVIVRKEGQVREWVGKKLDHTERYTVLRSPDGLGFRVAISSIRAKQLLGDLHADVLSPVFEKPNPWLEHGGVWSAWFGFSEPWNPPMHYTTLQ
jgi:hypothetical protein